MPKKKVRYVQSPLRYPGSKRDVEDEILRYIPPFKEFREPFFGSGALSLRVAQLFPDATIRGWDLHDDLVTTWKVIRDDPDALAERVREILAAGLPWRQLEAEVKVRLGGPLSALERAALYFTANRSSWCGAGILKGFTENSHRTLFTESSIERLVKASPIVHSVQFTHGDYTEALSAPGEGAFIFLDPPYLGPVTSHLYKGHDCFDHERFLKAVEACRLPFLITYDDSPVVREMFEGTRWHIEELCIQYRSTNKRVPTIELLIANYDLQKIAAEADAAAEAKAAAEAAEAAALKLARRRQPRPR